MDNERYPIDYNRRWPLIKRNHETGTLVIAATARTGTSSISQEESAALSSPVPKVREDFGRKRVAILKDLLMRYLSVGASDTPHSAYHVLRYDAQAAQGAGRVGSDLGAAGQAIPHGHRQNTSVLCAWNSNASS